MELKEHIFLIGFMGAGKSTCAECLRDLTGARVCEMDAMIEEQQKRKISEIFEQDGETFFRDLETKLLKEIIAGPAAVVSCGGGLILREENVRMMKKAGKVVLLTAEPETILDRVKGSSARPLLNGHMNCHDIGAMMEKRRPGYEAAADVSVTTDGKAPAAIAEEILSIL